jgi:hypothetical protein
VQSELSCTKATALAALVALFIAGAPAAAAPLPFGVEKADGKMLVMAKVWSSHATGSYTVAYNVQPRVELDAGDLSWAQPDATATSDPPFPADAADLQDWIGTGTLDLGPL